MIHELKTLTNYFSDVISGRKTFEVRKNDRPFHVGDLLALNEFDEKNKCYTGNSCLVYVDYILNDREYCKKEQVIMSIKPCAIHRFGCPRSVVREGADYTVPYATRGDDS